LCSYRTYFFAHVLEQLNDISFVAAEVVVDSKHLAVRPELVENHHRLANEEAKPHQVVSVLAMAGLVEFDAEDDEGHLPHHACKHYPVEVEEDHLHQQFVEQRTNQECEDHGGHFVELHQLDGLEVEVAQAEVVDRQIPLAPEDVQVRTVPPVQLEPPVSKASDLSQDV